MGNCSDVVLCLRPERTLTVRLRHAARLVAVSVLVDFRSVIFCSDRMRGKDQTMKYRLAIFDLDGTVLNTLDDLAAALCHALEKNGMPPRTREEVRGMVGNGIRRLCERGVPEGTDSESVDRVYGDFMDYYTVHMYDSTVPYDGVLPLLSRLSACGVRTAVVSNKRDGAVRELCKRFFPAMFDITVGEREGVARKPAPDSVLQVLRSLGYRREEAVYIGDSDVDIQTARAADIDCISVDWGFRDRAFLESSGASVIVSDTSELLSHILGELTDHAEIAVSLFREGYNCAQATFLAFSDLIGMDRKTALRLSSSFGGGMGRLREVCGAMSGVFMVAGLLWGYEKPGDLDSKKAHYARIQSLAEAFRARRGSIVCRELMRGVPVSPGPEPAKRDEGFYAERPCLRCISDAASILDDMIRETGAYKQKGKVTEEDV